MNLNEGFKEFIELLNRHDVGYLIIGGYAVSFHGHPRYTKDIYIWIDRTDSNADRALEALAEFGFGNIGIRKEDLIAKGNVIQLGYPPRRIDLLTSIPGVEFDQCFKNSITSLAGEVELRFIGLEDLKASKLATGRPQDLADVDHLSE